MTFQIQNLINVLETLETNIIFVQNNNNGPNTDPWGTFNKSCPSKYLLNSLKMAG